MIKLLTVNSFFNVYPTLLSCLDGKTSTLNGKNVIFCEEKVSLMTERYLCGKFGGSFNTEVYSFGNYLRVKKPMRKVLTKEGSAMAVKRILTEVELGCFKEVKVGLAPSMFDLIIQLKSARVSCDDILYASNTADGVLKAKLKDIAVVYSAYEKYLAENGLEDQSSSLRYLPEIITESKEISNANVFLVGFSGFTLETRRVVSALLKTAKSVTAILPEGENRFAFVNESAEIFRNLCAGEGLSFSENKIQSGYSREGKIIVDGIFGPKTYKNDKINTDKVFYSAEYNPAAEAEKVASIIKQTVIDTGARYKDFTVIVPDPDIYRSVIKSAFNLLEIPYFFDEKKQSFSHPLIRLIVSYIDIFRRGLTRKNFIEFVKNPLFSEDKNLTDKLANYLLKYNIDYSRLKTPFSLFDETEKEYSSGFEELRLSAMSVLEKFSVEKMLDGLGVKDKISENSEKLVKEGFPEESALNDQVYEAVTGILAEMQVILGDKNITKSEYGKIFESGISALELSIIPQYNDAVFIGGFKESALSISKNLFVLGLTDGVPNVKDDVALLSDGDIDSLSQLSVLVEPKIKIINHRTREEVALGISAFSERLFLSYPIADFSGNNNAKSEILIFAENSFTLKEFPKVNGYLSKKQSVRTFAEKCGRFYDGRLNDFTDGSSIYKAVGKDVVGDILESVNREVKVTLNSNAEVLVRDVTSPTAIEDYFKCPYRSFLTHGLKIQQRETGVVDNLKTGNFIHGVFQEFVPKVYKIKDERDFENRFNETVESVLKNKNFVSFFSDSESEIKLEELIRESKKFCKRTWAWLLRSEFRAEKSRTEVKFGDAKGCVYPSVPLLNGKIKLSGKIDRVDEFGEYCRIIDYKTGSADDSDKSLFDGTKLQLYLYGSAVKDKKLAGAYYLPVYDYYSEKDGDKKPFVLGKTLNDDKILIAQDKDWNTESGSEILPVEPKDGEVKNAVTEEQMQAFVSYALKVSEKAAERLNEGVIVASPIEGACEYCEFRAICGKDKLVPRKVYSVNDETIENSVNPKSEGPNEKKENARSEKGGEF